MKKQNIINAGVSGLPLRGIDVARVSRDKRRITLRHAWKDDVDGRVWAAIRAAFGDLARSVVKSTRKSVQVYAYEGYMIDQYEPESPLVLVR